MSLALSARLNTRFGERSVLLVGLALIVVGLALLGSAPISGSFPVDVLPAMLFVGVGFGMAMPALMALGMSSATAQDAGLASGLFNTSQQVGGALGLSVLAVVAATRHHDLKDAGRTEIAAQTGGYHLAFVVAACLVVAALVAAAIVLKRRPAAETSIRTGGVRVSGEN